MEQLTRVAALELGARGITANVVSPGFTDTELLRGVTPEEALPQLAKMSPLGRLGRPQDIADVIAMLVGPDGGVDHRTDHSRQRRSRVAAHGKGEGSPVPVVNPMGQSA